MSRQKPASWSIALDLIQLWTLIRRNWLVLLAFLAAGAAAGAILSYLQPEVYAATTNGYVVAGNSSSVSEALIGRELASDKAASYLPLAQSRSVAEAVAEELGVNAGSISLSATNEGVIFSITARAQSAQLARDVADAGMRATSIAANELETMTVSGESTGETVVRIVPVEMALTPTSPVSPNWSRTIALGLALGLLAGFGFVVLRQSLDRKVRLSSDVAELTGVSALGVIPTAPELAGKRGRTAKRTESQGAAIEALRKLRTNLRYVSVDDPLHSIVVTSPNEGEGKSTIAFHLAQLLARSGYPTILIDADLRRPRLAHRFGVDGTVGLTQVLAGTATIDDALISISTALTLLPSGKIPPNPSELVGSRRMKDLLTSLSKTHMVVIDAPPILPVTDAGLLTASSDGALLVVHHGKTRKEEVTVAVQNLANVRGTLLGFVMNMVPAKDMGSTIYGYGYGTYRSHEYQSNVMESAAAEPVRHER